MFEITIKNGNIKQPLHNPYSIYEDEKIASGTIIEEINAISSFEFVIYPNNPCYNRLNAYTTNVEVFNVQKNRFEFLGRVLKVTPQMDNDGMIYKNIVCESYLGFLNDTIQPYSAPRYYEGDDARNGLQEFIDIVLNYHNEQVGDEKKIYRGLVMVNPFKTSDNVYKGLNYEKTWDIITSKLIGSFGGEIAIRKGEDGLLYLDYSEKFGQQRSTTIEIAKNIESQSRDIDPSNIITRLIPLGIKQTDSEGNETEERLTIESVNDGIPYIVDSTAEARYGIIYGVHEWDDVTVASNLKIKGETFLVENNRVAISDTISAVDLSLLGLDIDDFRLYDSYPVYNSLIGVRDELRIIKKTTNVIEPYASSFDLGSSSKALSDTIVDYENAIENINKTESSLKTEIKNQNNNTYTYVEEKFANFKVDEDEITAIVQKETVAKSDYETFTETVRNILSMDENGTTMLFNTIYEEIARVEGIERSNYSNILKYIRFEAGNIILGEEGNDLTLTISNDRISFKQNGIEVAYMSDNNLYIGNAVIKEGGRLQLGNFELKPRADGSLSCLKVGG